MQRLGRRRLPLEPMPFRQQIDDIEADVVAGAGVPAAGIA